MIGYAELAIKQLKGVCPQCEENKGNTINITPDSVTDDLSSLQIEVKCNHCGCTSILVVETLACATQYKFI
jgi:hypothetical protein